MRRIRTALGLALLLGGAAFSGVRGQEPDRPNSEAAPDSARALADQLLGQVEAKRLDLQRTELLLEQAKELVARQERRARDEKRAALQLAWLRHEAEFYSRHLSKLKGIGYEDDSPACLHAGRYAAAARDEIRRLEGRADGPTGSEQ